MAGKPGEMERDRSPPPQGRALSTVLVLCCVVQLMPVGGWTDVDSQCSRNSFGHLSELRIAAPADGATVWGAFTVRIEFSHRVSPVMDPPEALPQAFDVMLDGDHVLKVALKNSTRSFYLIHLPMLPAGSHLLEVAKRHAGDDDEESPVWAPHEVDRARYQSMGRERPIPEPAQRQAGDGYFSITTRRRLADGVREERQRWPPERTAILVVDMWKFHGCYPAMLRAHALAAPINRVISAARQRGSFIVHVPSRSGCRL
jgi:hypothetical protein